MSSAVHRRRLCVAGEIAVILLVFAASVILRWDQIDRTPSGGHEWLTAQTAIVHDIWHDDGGAAASYFAMRMQYSRDADKYINNASMGNHYPGYPDDGAGNYYYMSHATLGLVAPYVVMRMLGQSPSVLGIQLFNLAIHLLCALLLYACVRMAMPREGDSNLPATLASILYLGVPVALWFHANVYFVEIFVQLPFIATVLAVLWYLRRRERRPGRGAVPAWSVAALVAATCLSEWMGYTLALAIVTVALVPALGGRDFRLAVAAVGGAAFGGSLFFLQHALIVGPAAFANHLLQQFLYRSWAENSEMLRPDVCIPQVDLANIPVYYLAGYRPMLPLLLVLLAGAVIGLLCARRRERTAAFPWRMAVVLSVLVAVPPLLHHLLLASFTAQHSYAVLKSGFALAVLAAMLASLAMRWRPAAVFAAIGLPVLLIVLAPKAIQGYRDYATITAGGIGIYQAPIAAIRDSAGDDQALFMITPCLVRPQVLYLTGRNIQPVSSIEEARQWLRDSPNTATEGLVFQRGRGDFTRIGLESD